MICSSGLASLPLYHTIPRYVLVSTGIFSNILLLFGMITNPLKCFRNSSSFLIMNLAVMDILTCSSNFLFLHWPPCVKGHEIYRFFNFPIYIAVCSIFTMACDRYMSCVHPFRYRVLNPRKVALTVIFLKFLLCAGHMIFEMFFLNVAFYTRCVIAVFILLSTAILYARSAYVLKVNSRYLKDATAIPSNSQGRFTRSARLVNEKRLLTTMLLVSLITVATLAPALIYESVTETSNYVNEYSSEILDRDIFHIWVHTLFLVNFSINPVLYVWRLKNFRETFLTLFFSVCHLREN